MSRSKRSKIMENRRKKSNEKFDEFKKERQRVLNIKTLKEMELTDESDSSTDDKEIIILSNSPEY